MRRTARQEQTPLLYLLLYPLTACGTLSQKLDLLGHGGAQLIAGKAAIGALETLGKGAVIVGDGEGATLRCSLV